MAQRVYLRDFILRHKSDTGMWTDTMPEDVLKEFPYHVPVCKGANTTLALYYSYKQDYMIVSNSNYHWHHLAGGWFKNSHDALLFRLKFPEIR